MLTTLSQKMRVVAAAAAAAAHIRLTKG